MMPGRIADYPQPFVHIWQGCLPLPASVVADFNRSLSEDERQRAGQYRTAELQQRYCSGRGLIRQVLAHYLSVDPATLPLHVDAHGKPQLTSQQLSFNLSHSGTRMALAVSNLACVGLDIEMLKPRPGLPRLARHCLSDPEWAFWQALPESQQLVHFYRLWTIKEAFVKACGRGLAAGLANCVVDVEYFSRFIGLPAGYGDPQQWTIAHSALLDDHCLAVVTPQSKVECQWFRFEDSWQSVIQLSG